MKRLGVLVSVLLASALVAYADQRSQVSPATLGLNGVAFGLDGGVTSTAILLDDANVGTFNQLTLEVVATPGTSTVLSITCKGSVDGSTFAPIQTCYGPTCTPRVWEYAVSTNATFLLNFPVNYKSVKCSFVDGGFPDGGVGYGSGTVVVTATRGRQ